MKKMLCVGLTALGLMLAAHQEASAWINFKFSAGVNWQWQSGGNNLFWGAFSNGQPGFGAFQSQPYPHHPPGQFQWFGAAPQQQAPASVPANTQAPTGPQAYYAPSYDANPYRTVGYSGFNIGNYQPNYDWYYTPGYYGYQYSPSYWFGR